MASRNFLRLASNMANADVDFGAGAFKALLVDGANVPDETALDTWNDRADVLNEHPATGGYVAGGFGVTVDSITDDAPNDRVAVTITPTDVNPQYSSSTISSQAAIIYLDTGVAANDVLVGMVDFGSVIASDNGDFNVTFNTPLYINV